MNYVVIRRGWEYNDENYYRAEEEGGKPVKVFDDRKKAEKYCMEQNIECLRGLTPCNYSEEVGHITNIPTERFVDLWNRTFGTTYDVSIDSDSFYDNVWWELAIPEDATQAQLMSIYAVLNSCMQDYQIYEVD